MDKEINRRKPPIVDLTSIVGIESLFRGGTSDPWALEIAAHFADLFIWSDRVRYILPIPSERYPFVPRLVEQIRSHEEEQVLEPEQYLVSESPKLRPEYAEEFFQVFAAWVLANRRRFSRWITLHDEARIRSEHQVWIGRDFFYKVEDLRSLRIFNDLISQLGIEPRKILYAFDVALRYPYYGELAGKDAFYLAHPIRSGQSFPTLEREEGPQQQIPISFKITVEKLVRKMTQTQFTLFLRDARNLVRQMNLHKLKPGEVERDTCRELAQKLHLPAHLKKTPKILGAVGTGLIAGAGLEPHYGDTVSSIATVVTSIGAVVWDRPLPKSVSRIKWLSPLFKWDLENGVQNHR